MAHIAGSADSAVDVLRSGLCDAHQRLARARIVGLEGTAIRRILKLAVDQQLRSV